ncbi:MAG: hypothetical protein JXB04_10305 [Kiritimatiellae bacterium]|nr:hypothetical protein [Kiritimatiellia bacterium]
MSRSEPMTGTAGRAICLLSAATVACLAVGCASGPSSRAPIRYDKPRPVRDDSLVAPPPRVMLLIEERSLGTIPTAEVEALAIELLINENVPLVDQEMVRTNLKKKQQMFKLAGDARAAAMLGLEFGADVVIVGEAVAKPAARRIAESNLRAYQAVVTLKAVRADNSEPIASVSETASQVGLEDVAGSSQVLKAAGQAALEKLIPRMLQKWQGYVSTGGRGRLDKVVLTIGGIDQAWKLKSVREALRGRGQLQNVVQRSYTAGVAVFEADAKIPADELAEEMVIDPPEGLRMQVISVARGSVELRAVSGR